MINRERSRKCEDANSIKYLSANMVTDQMFVLHIRENEEGVGTGEAGLATVN